MTTAARPTALDPATTGVRMTSLRRTAIAAGLFYLVTHVTSVPAPFLYAPVLSDPGYVVGPGADSRVILGAFLEVICALGIVGTAVALYPVVRRWGEGVALGYVGLRTLEAAIVAAGVLPLLAAVSLRQHLAGSPGADPASMVALGSTLASLQSWSHLVGPGLVCGVNTVLMAYLMYRSRLVPRIIPVLGLVGGPLVFAVNAGQLFGLYYQLPAWAALGVIPVFAWEVSLALRLILKGFSPAAIRTEPARADKSELLSAA